MFDSERAVIFIDGNNFYHAVGKLGLSSVHLNYGRFSERLVMERTWLETRYYVGKVPQKDDLTRYANQQKFISALSQFDRVHHYLGRLERRLSKSAYQNRLTKWLNALDNRTDISVAGDIIAELRKIADTPKLRYEEKAVDVMIATDMVSMAYQDKYDIAYLLSSDSDFVPAIETVRETDRKVFVASAAHAHKLAQVANVFIPLNREFFHGCWE